MIGSSGNGAGLARGPGAWPDAGWRAILAALAAGSVAWGAHVLATGFPQAPLSRISDQILRGETFSLSVLKSHAAFDQKPGADRARPRADILRQLVIVQAALVDQLQSGDPDRSATGFDAELERLQAFTIEALLLRPTDGFLWFILYWSKGIDGQRQSRIVPLLERSYQLSPHEGWLALKRSRVVLPILHQLPRNVAQRAVREFRLLLESGFEQAAAEILVLAPPGTITLLLDAIADTKSIHRLKLSENLRAAGHRIDVPGITSQELRPW